MVLPLSTRSHFLTLLINFTIILKLVTRSNSESDYTTVIYKDCANQSFTDPNGLYSQSLSNLYGTLIAQSSKSRFYKTTTSGGGGSSQSTITGLFQCRGDLSNVDCYSCVSNLPTLIDKLCADNPVASRLQLYGCYMMYEVSGFNNDVSGLEMLYKSCSGNDISGAGFEEKRDTALYSLQNGFVGSGGGGVNDGFYYATSYESVYAMGQCEGDLGSSDCVDCVRSAIQRAQVECGSSVSGMVFLSKCFVSFNYYPNGVPKKSSSASASFNSPASSSSSPSSSSSSSSSSFSSFSSSSGPSGGTNTGRTVAMILGGAAIVGFLIICVLFARGAAHRKYDGY